MPSTRAYVVVAELFHESISPEMSLRFGVVADDETDAVALVQEQLSQGLSARASGETLTAAEVATWRAGETILLSGRMLTGRDAAHLRMTQLLSRGEPLPVDLRGRAIYYVGPVDAVEGEAVGPAGPTTSTRMDKFLEAILPATGLLAMIGKAERGPVAIDAIRKHGCAYLIAVGGAAYLVSKAIRSARVLAFADLGMEAIHEFVVQDMPVTVAVDTQGNSVHRTGPARGKRPVPAPVRV